MYGYVRPHTAELKVADYRRYRAVYCGLCRAMGEVTGQLSRMSLSYDFTFYAAVRMVLTGEEPEIRPMRCPVHPLSKRLTSESGDALLFSAAVSAAFADAKTGDDLEDERGISLVKPVLRRPLTAHMRRRAEKLLPPGAPLEIVRLLGMLSAREKENSDSADEMAGLFGDVLGYAFSLGLEGETAQLARVIGRETGRFVYLMDALEDLPADVKRGRYNPLAAGWGALALEDGLPSRPLKNALCAAVPIGLEPLGEAAERLDAGHSLTPIIKNTVYLGLPAVLERVLSGRRAGEAEKEGGSLR